MKKSLMLIAFLLSASLVTPLRALGTNVKLWVGLGEIAEPQTRRTPNVPVGLKTSLDKIVESYRKIIVLLDDEATLAPEERNRCIFVGRKIHQEKQELLEEVTQTLTADLRRAIASRYQQKPEFIGGFIDYFNDTSSLRDVDRLAFVDLADELLSIDVEDERNHGLAKSSTQLALQRINDDLKVIQSVYQKEVSRVFSSLGTRGKALEREKWQDYVTFIKGLFNRDQVLTP